jgi:hypothetical protein
VIWMSWPPRQGQKLEDVRCCCCVLGGEDVGEEFFFVVELDGDFLGLVVVLAVVSSAWD